MIGLIKRFFGFGKQATQFVNETSHANPQLINLEGTDFKEAYQSDPHAVLLDVRTGMEAKHGTLPDAEHINMLSINFKAKVAELDKSKTYYVYCKMGGRSDSACVQMHNMGFDVRNLKGGKQNWPKDDDEPTHGSV